MDSIYITEPITPRCCCCCCLHLDISQHSLSLHLFSLATLIQPKSLVLPNSVPKILFYVSILLSLIGVFKSLAWHVETPLKRPKRGAFSDSKGSMHFISCLTKTPDHPSKRLHVIALGLYHAHPSTPIQLWRCFIHCFGKLKKSRIVCILLCLEIKVVFS